MAPPSATPGRRQREERRRTNARVDQSGRGRRLVRGWPDQTAGGDRRWLSCDVGMEAGTKR